MSPVWLVAELKALLDELGYGGCVGCEYRPLRAAVAGATSAGLGWLKTGAGADSVRRSLRV